MVERVSLPDSAIAIEGQFEPPVLARLSAEDQVFIMTFIQVHGSIKETERIFGISYPTVKNRLDAIAKQLPIDRDGAKGSHSTPRANPQSAAVLDSLERGEIDVEEALRRLS